MPFIAQEPRPFTRDGIMWLAPYQNGVYGIYNSQGWIYVGRGDLRARLLDHVNGDNPCILAYGPTHYVSEVWDVPDEREKQLILELRPACNQRVG